MKTVEIGGKRIKLQIWDTAGQERFRTITTAYYRGAMGILLVYDVTNRDSFENVGNWFRSAEKHTSEKVSMILVGNKCDLASERTVQTEEGEALATELGIEFFETSAKKAHGVEEAFMSLANAILPRLTSGAGGAAASGDRDRVVFDSNNTTKKKGCC